MRKFVFVLSALAVTGCQTAGNTYEPIIPNPENLEIAFAKCQMLSGSTQQGMVAWGSPGYVAGAQLGNAIGNAIRADQFVGQCMTIQGWRRVSVPNGGAPHPQTRQSQTDASSRKEISATVSMITIADYCRLPLKPDVRREKSALIAANPNLISEGKAAGMKVMNQNIKTHGKKSACDLADKTLKDMRWR